MLVVAYLSQYEFQFGIGVLGAVFIVSGVLTALGFGNQMRMSARAAHVAGMVIALVGLALFAAAVADFQPGCTWCRHDRWGGGTSPPPIFLVWLVGVMGIGTVQAARGIRARRQASDRSDHGWAAVSGSQPLAAATTSAANELSVVGGISLRSWGRFSWPMCRATVAADGVMFEARGPLRFIAPPFALRFSQMRSVERLQAPGLAGLYIYTTIQGFDEVLFSGWPTTIRMLEDTLSHHQVAITSRRD